jgi:porin
LSTRFFNIHGLTMRGVRSAAVAICAAELAAVLVASTSASSAAEDAAPSLPSTLHEITDILGVRSALEKAGVRFTFTYFGDAFANPVGGVKQGAGYDGRFGTIIDADLEKILGWQGASFHASIHQIHGTQFSATNLANLMTVSGIEAPPSTRLFNLWIEQKIGADFSVRAGQYTAAQEFLTSANANLFVNSTFGWPMAAAQDLPSGGPAYPEATPGLRLAWTPSDRLTVRAAVFNGDPAGPGPGNPVQRDPFGLAFRVNDPPFGIFETAYDWGDQSPAQTPAPGNPNQEGTDIGVGRSHAAGPEANLAGSLKLGAWLHTGSFADPRFDSRGELLAATGGTPRQHRGNLAAYAVVDQELWRVPGQESRNLNGFFRLSASPSDRNPVDLYADGGLTFNGPLAARPDDIIGLGVAWGRISPSAQSYDRDLIALTGQGMPVRDYELALELTYQWKIATNWMIQPDLQFILHPGGHVPLPAAASGGLAPAVAAATAIPDALVLGVRTIVKF